LTIAAYNIQTVRYFLVFTHQHEARYLSVVWRYREDFSFLCIGFSWSSDRLLSLFHY